MRAEIARLLAEPAWCLHCGSETCPHVARHNAAYGTAAHGTNVPVDIADERAQDAPSTSQPAQPGKGAIA